MHAYAVGLDIGVDVERAAHGVRSTLADAVEDVIVALLVRLHCT